MSESLQSALSEAKETFLGLVGLFKSLFSDIVSFPFIQILKSLVACIIAGIVTPFLIVFCYLASFAASPIEEQIFQKEMKNESKIVKYAQDFNWTK